MKYFVIAAICLISLSSLADDYDAALAEKLGADEYGMKVYVMAFLKKGPNREHAEEEAQRLQRAHLDNIRRMAEAGQLVVAGPFMPNEAGLQGIYIFNVDTVEKAQALTETDPAVQAGRLIMELYPWYGSAALVQTGEIHRQIARKNP